MTKLVLFKLVFRGESIWINPDHVVCVVKRAGLTTQTCIRLVNQPETEDMVVEGNADEVIQKLTGKAPEPAPRPSRSFALEADPPTPEAPSATA